MSVTQTFTASRNATWAPQLIYTYIGQELPLTGAHIAMQLRLYPGAADPPLLTLNDVPFVDELVSGSGRSATDRRSLTLSPSISVAQLRALPGLNTPEAGDSQAFAFDIRITYADGASEILSSGRSIVYPGVTTV